MVTHGATGRYEDLGQIEKMMLSRTSQVRMDRIEELQAIINKVRLLPDEYYPRKPEALSWMERQQSELVTPSMVAWALLSVLEATRRATEAKKMAHPHDAKQEPKNRQA